MSKQTISQLLMSLHLAWIQVGLGDNISLFGSTESILACRFHYLHLRLLKKKLDINNIHHFFFILKILIKVMYYYRLKISLLLDIDQGKKRLNSNASIENYLNTYLVRSFWSLFNTLGEDDDKNELNSGIENFKTCMQLTGKLLVFIS